MIKKIGLINFKSHKETTLRLENLTVLCGQNGTGKSSFLQSLLLLRQSHQKNRLDKVLDLNDPLCYLGRAQDVFYQFAEQGDFEDKIRIMVSDSTGKDYSWLFSVEKDTTYLKRITITDQKENDGYTDLPLFSMNFQYISAARNTESTFPDDYAVSQEKQLSQKEGKGELTAQFLYQWGVKQKILVHPSLNHPSVDKDLSLLTQVSAWEKEISKGVNIVPKQDGGNYTVKYQFNAELPTDEYSSRNVGFGLSYSLPVITAILSAQPGSLLLIENPEAHVHPYGQSKLAELICLAAQAGIQIIVETHSDHIINGILVQCKKYEEPQEGKEKIGIDRRNAKVYYFDRYDNNQATYYSEIEIGEGGRIRKRPPGFFDQIGKDLRKLL